MAERTVESRLRVELSLARRHAHTADAERAELEAELLRARAEAQTARAHAARARAATAARTTALHHLEDVWRRWFLDSQVATSPRAFIEGVGAEIKEVIEEAAEDGKPSPEDAAWGTVWLHSKWEYITRQMTTAERELAADAVARWSAALNAHDGEPTTDEPEGLRWWREAA
ncbi:hypothetical protein GT352_28325 [Streptomyces sp. SID1046]|nr:hypothetical protein [Streptomyces sp. SID1046]